MRLRTSIFRIALASGFGKASTVLVRLAQVPILLSALGVDEYGRWLVLFSLPAWLTMANLGFGSVAANEIPMAVAANDVKRARSVYSTTLAMIAAIGLAGTVIAVAFFWQIPWEKFLGVSALRHTEISIAAILLAVGVFASFANEVFGGRFRAARRTHIAVLIASFRPWFELAAVVAVLQFTTRFDYIAGATFGATFVFLLAMALLSRHHDLDINFSLADISKLHLRMLFVKGISFQAFPVGNALLFQGNLLLVQLILGPASVALFGTARTLVRSISQVMEMANQVVWADMSHLLGGGDLKNAARLHRISVVLSVVAASIGLIVLLCFGNWIFKIWTGGALGLSAEVLLLFLLPIPFNALWFTSSVVHAASNQHEGLALRYLIATSAACLTCAVLAYFYGIGGAAVSTVVADVILIPYVLRRSLQLTGDSWQEFLVGIRVEFGNLFSYLKRRIYK